jgi:hypothetical protein
MVRIGGEERIESVVGAGWYYGGCCCEERDEDNTTRDESRP